MVGPAAKREAVAHLKDIMDLSARWACQIVSADRKRISAAKTAQIHDFIISLPDGYQTRVGERGYRFSGGKKQRFALARTLLRNPPVPLLDEATSALDNATESTMSAVLAKMASSRTVISIAHRLSTVRNADRIFVLKDGKLVEQGTHEEIAKANSIHVNLLRTGI